MLAVLSDVHANQEALRAVLADMLTEGAGACDIALLGDIIGFHAQPGECVQLLRERALRAAVRGNHEEALRHRNFFGNMPLIDQMVERTRSMLAAEDIAWLTALPLTAEAGGLFFAHSTAHEPGAWGRIRNEAEARAAFGAQQADVAFFGHTHRPTIFRLSPNGELAALPIRYDASGSFCLKLDAGARYLVNPGAVGQPRDGDPRAAYALYDEATRTLCLRRVTYDVAATAACLPRMGLPESFGEALKQGRSPLADTHMNTDPEQETPRKRSRRWFLKGLAGVGALAAAGAAVDWVLPRTLCRPGEWNGPVTDHFNGTRFYNPEPGHSYGDARAGARWLFSRHERRPYPIVEQNEHRPELAASIEPHEWEVTMVNHATMLIRLAGCTVLTDPVWSDYTSPIQGIGPKRTRPAGMAWEEVPHVDVCLLSHDHYDHFDVTSLQRLTERDNPLYVVPLGLASLLRYHCGEQVRVVELDWWQTTELTHGLRCHVVPAYHWSRRYRTEATANRSLWCGFYLEGAGRPTIYYAGDTAMTRWFTEIRRRLGAPTLALLPIGAYKPGWIRNNHISPADAVEAFGLLCAERALACHWGTWQLANEGWQETLDDLAAALAEAGVEPVRFRAPLNGQTLRGSF